MGSNFFNFNVLGVFRKNNTFGGMKILWILFGGHHKIGLHFNRCHFYAFYGLFFRSRYRMGDIFWVAKIPNIFGVLEIPDILGGWGGEW